LKNWASYLHEITKIQRKKEKPGYHEKFPLFEKRINVLLLSPTFFVRILRKDLSQEKIKFIFDKLVV